jgi:hypothetical protein
VLSSQQTAMDIIGQAIGVIAWSAEYTDCIRKYQLIYGVPGYIAKEKILLGFIPYRAFRKKKSAGNYYRFAYHFEIKRWPWL